MPPINNNHKSQDKRNLIVVSGYYGFGNLGDEAILEELLSELDELGLLSSTVVLSNSPNQTAKTFSVRTSSRWDFLALANLLRQSQLFISGGGGLFQDTKSAGSVIYYALQIALAKLLGAKVMIYAQGLGPLQRQISQVVCRQALSKAEVISLRDERSLEIAGKWRLSACLTEDPVWCLKPSDLPDEIKGELARFSQAGQKKLVGLSLRQWRLFGARQLEDLVHAMAKALPKDTHVVLLPLQKEFDEPLLNQFKSAWQAIGRQADFVSTHLLSRPSQWLSLFSSLDFLIAMRLHALLMAVKSGVPAVGINYDPKVASLLARFQQPMLNLGNEESQINWTNTLEKAIAGAIELATAAKQGSQKAKDQACQNFDLLAKILAAQKSS
jgi:polysaccharide pyruvyl transferase CsaB